MKHTKTLVQGPNKNILTSFKILLISLVFLTLGIAIFTHAYNSVPFAEKICQSVKKSYDIPTRISIDELSNAKCEVFLDNNWINACNAKMEVYCTAIN